MPHCQKSDAALEAHQDRVRGVLGDHEESESQSHQQYIKAKWKKLIEKLKEEERSVKA